MSWVLVVLLGCLFLAYSNGANDNFKGVATLFGSETTNYRKALVWATVTTLGGSLTAAFFSAKLARAFSGKGLVPDELVRTPEFLVAVMIGAAGTVFLATWIGIPISTTHSLVGSLAGAGLVSVGSNLNFSALGTRFFLPLLISPLLALAGTGILYPIMARTRKALGIGKSSCVCLTRTSELGSASPSGMVLAVAPTRLSVEARQSCSHLPGYEGRILGIQAQGILDFGHYLSAGAVGFARGLNDTPKIVGVALAATALGMVWLTFLAAVLMALGGLFHARKVGHRMSKGITPLNHGQGFTANLVTSLLVIGASRFGVPVSTTHVSCGSLFGIGITTGAGRWRTISGIIGAWVLTLPLAATLAATTAFLLKL
jgi:PiT family inorganic phosphate transporter